MKLVAVIIGGLGAALAAYLAAARIDRAGLSRREYAWSLFTTIWNEYTRPALMVLAVGAIVVGPLLEVLGLLPDTAYEGSQDVIAGFVVGITFALLARWRPSSNTNARNHESNDG